MTRNAGIRKGRKKKGEEGGKEKGEKDKMVRKKAGWG